MKKINKNEFVVTEKSAKINNEIVLEVGDKIEIIKEANTYQKVSDAITRFIMGDEKVALNQLKLLGSPLIGITSLSNRDYLNYYNRIYQTINASIEEVDRAIQK